MTASASSLASDSTNMTNTTLIINKHSSVQTSATSYISSSSQSSTNKNSRNLQLLNNTTYLSSRDHGGGTRSKHLYDHPKSTSSVASTSSGSSDRLSSDHSLNASSKFDPPHAKQILNNSSQLSSNNCVPVNDFHLSTRRKEIHQSVPLLLSCSGTSSSNRPSPDDDGEDCASPVTAVGRDALKYGINKQSYLSQSLNSHRDLSQSLEDVNDIRHVPYSKLAPQLLEQRKDMRTSDVTTGDWQRQRWKYWEEETMKLNAEQSEQQTLV